MMTGDKTILICDDDEGILDMLSMVLDDSGYRTIILNNSLEVLQTVQQQNPDLLIIDLWMPVLSGDQIVRTLRENTRTTKLPVIVISASTDGNKIAMGSGANEFIAKPFDFDNLIGKITHCLS